MRKQQEKSPAPAFDHEKSAAARKEKAAAVEAAGLRLKWTRKLAIMAWCHQCMNNQPAEVRRCGDSACPLWLFRCRQSPTAAQMKEFEKDFTASADGKRFLKEDAVEENEECESTGALDLPPEDAW